jgi:hypothetical protein
VSQKCNLNNIFHESKGHSVATGKGALFVSSENLGGLDPLAPGSYAPVRIGNTDMIGNRENVYIDAIMPKQILMVELI